MQKSAYYCDQCKKIIGEVPHVSLNSNPKLTGIAFPPHQHPRMTDLGHWYVESVATGFMHFHIQCLEKYFNNLITKKHDKAKK